MNDSASTAPGTPVTIAVLDNDSDPDVGDVLTIQSVSTPSNGTATIVSGQVQYTPTPGFTGPTDTFTYTISDGHGGTATATVTVTITVSNRPPIARNDTTTNLWAMNPDFEASTAGWDGTLATVTRMTGPACNLASAKVSADPGAPFYRAWGPVGTLSGNTAGRVVTVGGWVRGEGSSVGRSFKMFANVFGSGAGAEVTASSYTLTAEWQWVSHTAVIAAPDQTGIQAFFQREGDPVVAGEYFYFDGAKAEGGPITTPSATPVTVAVLADDCDPDNDALTVTAVGSTPNGVAVINGDGTITFTPNLGFSGVATLTYTISDGRGGTSTAQVSVTVAAPANRPPVAVDDSATTTVDTPVTINVLVNDSDPDGDTITVSSVQPVSTHGTVVIVGGQPKYTPNAGFTGFDIFEYTISDGRGGTATANVVVTINPAPNRPPVAVDDSATTNVDVPVTVSVLTNDTDPDGDTLTVTAVGSATNGSVVLVAGQPKFTPNAGFIGTGTFEYTISDGRGGTDVGLVTVTITAAPNRPPVAVNDTATTTAGTPVTINVLVNDSDPDNDPLTVTNVTQGTNGTVVIVGGQPKYTPNPGFTGTDTFTYTISDGRGGTATATVTVTVNAAPNRPPVAVNDTATTPAGTPVTIAVLTNDSDPDGDTITVTSVTQPATGGTVAIVSGQPKFTPAAGFTGTATFTYTISDGRGGTATATVTVTVTPVVDNTRIIVQAAGCLILEVKPSDADYTSDFWQYLPAPAKSLGVHSKQPGVIVRLGTFTVGQELQLGIVVRNTGKTFKMGPAANNGDSLVHARVTTLAANTWLVGFEDIWGGGDLDFNDAQAEVRPGPCPGPDAVDDSATTTAGTPVTINVLTNDTGSAPLTLVSVTQPATGGTAAIVSGQVRFTPNSGFAGTATFTYTMRDSTGGTDTATVTVTVAGDERFMTGGGSTYIGSGRNRQKVNIGFELRCRGTGNFELNVRQPGHDDDNNGADAFKLDRITSMYCWNNPSVSSNVPSANWDTMSFTGTGRWKGVGGATIKATLVDAGEPGRNDTIEVKITDSRGTVVYTGRIGGNNQAHGNGPSNPPPSGF